MRKLSLLILLATATAFAQNPAQQPTDQPSGDISVQEQISDRELIKVLGKMKDGLESHSQRRFLSAFDPSQMEGYLEFQDRISELLRQYYSFAVRYDLVQTKAENERIVALVDFQLEASRQETSISPLRRNQRIRLDLAKTKKGWEIVDLQPREFFNP